MEKVQDLIDKGLITLDDIIDYLNNPDSHYQVIDLWED